MSYSFRIHAETKALVLERVMAELDRAIDNQPEHKHDVPIAKATAEALVALLPEEPGEGKLYYVNGNGSVGGNWGAAGLEQLTNATVNFTAGTIHAEAAR